jgi:pimeloyl-ACP methyl ester carboxylesterase
MVRLLTSKAVVLIMAAAIPAVPRLCAQPAGVARIPLPADLSGTLNGTRYKILVPGNWDGTLLIYVHGYLFTPAAQVAPSTFPSASPTLEDQLLSLGYALAGSFFVENSLREGIQQTLALTNFFKGHVGNPERTIVWGNSMGALISVKLIETYPGIYDGAISNCNGIGGLPKQLDSTLAFSLAYAAAFGWPSAWGPVEDLRDALDLFAEVIPLYQSPSATTFGRWEFIRLVMKLPPPAWWVSDPLDAAPGLAYQLFQATTRRSELEQEYGGPIAQNIGTVYTLTDGDKAYLASLGVDANELLAWMNTRTNIAARRSAREHLEHYGSPTGDLARPVVSMHKIFDGDVRVSHEAVYRDLVAARGNSEKLVQAYVNAAGHCSFSTEQYLSTVAAIQHWLDTGVRPDASFFQASLGFDNSFVPPPWPY